MKKMPVIILALTLLASLGFAQRITESLDSWTLGTNTPEVSSGTRGDASSGGYIHVLVGTSPFYYEVMVEGEGIVDFWIYDPGNCLEDPDPGYGTSGPGWGLQSPLYQACVICINRKSYIAGCQGYSPWSTVSPYSPWWYVSGLRASSGVPYTAQWTRWSVHGTWDNITFGTYDIDYMGTDDVITHGDVSRTYDATSFNGSWEALFGEGWKALYIMGDNSSGIEDIDVDVTGGTGVFAEFGAAAAQPYVQTSWGNVKTLYR